MRPISLLKPFALVIALCMLIGAAPHQAFADEDPDTQLVLDGLQLARKNKGPILWYVRDPEKKEAMENDLELLLLYNEAFKARKTRRAIGAGLFYPGLAIAGIGLVGGLFQHVIGLYDQQTGTKILIGGIAGGALLMAPGIYFQSKESKEEKAYKKYVTDKYEILPILKKQPDGKVFYALAIGRTF